ncbi:MAG: ornithine carbamoyltransferase [Granulosicoccaceae bacterium]
MTTRHFLVDDDLSTTEYKQLLARAAELKKLQKAGTLHHTCAGKAMAMVFEKSSTRTRISFETGMFQLGGHALHLSSRDTQLGRGEPVEDTARVFSEMVDIVMIRTFEQSTVETLAKTGSIPVINGLTDDYHPCQLLADMQTWFDNRGDIQGATVAWVGDGNNMCNSYIRAARLLDFNLVVACPEGFEPPERHENDGNRVRIVRDPREAAQGADLIATDVWASMGQEEDAKARNAALGSYCVDDAVMAESNRDSLFMHCLPAHRGEEVTASVIDGERSIVWEQAGNRLHAQKALVEFLLNS